MVIKCKMCGGDLHVEENAATCECEYCGSVQTIVNPDNEKKVNLFNRANRLRMNAEFDKAGAVYEQLVAEFPEEAEAYWGLCLCAYGIEYVDDAATGKKVPTCHRTLTGSIMEDGNFEQACDNADVIARKQYREEAKEIDRIQKEILTIASSEAPYDVFICYKETAADGSRTQDSVLAQEIYDALTAKGMKVFFSRITLEDKLGAQYEPYIYAALSSAKVMIAVGTAFEYYDAVWVKNEWSRYLHMMKTDKTKSLIPCFKELDAYDMPKEFKGLQAQDMNKLGWLQDLVRGVEKLCGKNTPAAAQQTVVREVVKTNGDAENLMRRIYLFLEDADWEQAKIYIDRVLDIDAVYAPAYLAKVLIKKGLKSEASLATLRKTIDDDPDWQKALRFANAEQKQTYTEYAKTINDNEAYDREQERIAAEQARIAAEQERIAAKNKARIEAEQARIAAENKAKEEKYNAAVTAMNNQVLFLAVLGFDELGDYKDSKDKLRKCIDAYRLQLEAEDRKNDPALAEAKEKTERAQRTADRAQTAVNDAKREKTEAEECEHALSDEISKLSNELSMVHGLFSGGKKRELERKIDALKCEQTEAAQRKQKCEQKILKAKAEARTAESALDEAKASQTRIETEMQKKELTCWTDEAIITAAAAAVAREAKWQVGNYVTFGSYPQTKAGNDTTPIEWLVLARDGDKALVISRYALDAEPYNTEYTSVTWETCSLRTWLNNDFYNKAFSAEEKESIVLSKVTADKNPKYSTNPGNDTNDNVFLLSIPEVNNYFKDDASRRCVYTDYAVKNGTYAKSMVDGRVSCRWWLRSPGLGFYAAPIVDYGGSVCLNGCDVRSKKDCVRPCVWVRLF